jgi:hypothetical protein
LELIETSTFTKQITSLFSDEEYVRVPVPACGESTAWSSHQARVIYCWAVRRDMIMLLYAYPKNVTTDLTPKQVLQLARVVKEELDDEKGNV